MGTEALASQEALLVAGVSEVRRLLAAGDAKGALKAARRLHTPPNGNHESAAALADACVARIRGLIERGLLREAEGLLGLLRQDLPLDERRSFEVAKLLAFFGDPGTLLAPLADPRLDPEKRRLIEEAVERVIVDPAAVEACGSLPREHPLRRSAAAVAAALAQVTSGSLPDEPEALTAVPRRGPFASWKLLVRAIHMAGRGDTDGCRRSLAMIDPGSAPGQVVPAVDAFAGGARERAAVLAGPADELVKRLRPDQARLREALRHLDGALQSDHGARPDDDLVRTIREAVAECERCRPDLLQRLRQRISVLGVQHDWPHGLIRKGLGKPSLKDADFWRLYARAMEARGDAAHACAAWDRFLRHAVHAGWFAADGAEAAGVYLHMAGQLDDLSKRDLAAAGRFYATEFDGFAGLYGDQPAEIRQLGPRRGENPDLFFLDPHELYGRAVRALPSPEVFSAWHARLAELGAPQRKALEVAERWHEAIPDDPRPLVRLMEAAESRGAFRKALRYLGEAESLDALNPQVRQARFRLWAASARRHIRQGNRRLLCRDVAELEAMAPSDQRGRRAVVEVVRAIAFVLAGDAGQAEAACEEATGCLGSASAVEAIIASVTDGCRDVRVPVPAGPGDRLAGRAARPAEALALAAAALDDAGLGFRVPEGPRRDLIKDLDKATDADAARMLRLAEAALRSGDGRLAYASAGCGLRAGEGAPYRARLLAARGEAIPERSAARKAQVLRAAGTIARRTRDQATAARTFKAFQDVGPYPGCDEEDWKEGLGEQEIEDVVAREAGERAYPSDGRRGGGQNAMLIEDLFEDPPRHRRRPGRRSRSKAAVDELGAIDLEALVAQLPDEVLEMLGIDAPPAVARVMLKVYARCGGPDGATPDPEQMMRDCPDLVKEMEEAMRGCDPEVFAHPRPRRRPPRRGKTRRRKR